MDPKNKEHTLKKVMVLGAIAVVIIAYAGVSNVNVSQQASSLRSPVAQNSSLIYTPNNIPVYTEDQMIAGGGVKLTDEQSTKLEKEISKAFISIVPNINIGAGNRTFRVICMGFDAQGQGVNASWYTTDPSWAGVTTNTQGNIYCVGTELLSD